MRVNLAKYAVEVFADLLEIEVPRHVADVLDLALDPHDADVLDIALDPHDARELAPLYSATAASSGNFSKNNGSCP
jgi:hypothetical protein